MTREQYIKILQRELDKLNKQIDMKIMEGVSYSKEAKEHKLLLRKMHQHTRKSFFNKIFSSLTLQF
jgi:hypothetical protein